MKVEFNITELICLDGILRDQYEVKPTQTTSDLLAKISEIIRETLKED